MSPISQSDSYLTEMYRNGMMCKPIPPHVEFPMALAQYFQLRISRWDLYKNIMFCESRGTAYILDPDDPDDMRILRNLENETLKMFNL